METSSLKDPRHFQESELRLFLEAIEVEFPIKGRAIGNDLFVTDLKEIAGRTFNARGNKSVLLSYQIDGVNHPVSIFFIEAETQKFGLSTLVLESYSDHRILPLLSAATNEFFSRDAEALMTVLSPEWKEVKLEGLVDKRILWEQELKEDFCPSTIKELKTEMPKFPVFPSVYHVNNPYLKNLIEESLPEIKPGSRVLIMGSGVGLETVMIAKKIGIQIDATDINPVAVANTNAIAARAQMSSYIHAWQSDLFSAVYEKYDFILFNAPLAGNKKEIDPNRFDFQGKLLRRLFDELPAHLNPGGRLFLMSLPKLDEYLPTNMQLKVRRTFNAVIECAILEVSKRPLDHLDLENTNPAAIKNAEKLREF
ncbi:MAG: methyltransferase [Bacteriovoracaceae bacterium]|nr:methyltransferase [Bacteriovoracaceae bacterium]